MEGLVRLGLPPAAAAAAFGEELRRRRHLREDAVLAAEIAAEVDARVARLLPEG